jgi:hypothetical protein
MRGAQLQIGGLPNNQPALHRHSTVLGTPSDALQQKTCRLLTLLINWLFYCGQGWGRKGCERDIVEASYSDISRNTQPQRIAACIAPIVVKSLRAKIDVGGRLSCRVVENRELTIFPSSVAMSISCSRAPGVQLTETINNTGFPEPHTLINGSSDGTVGQISDYLDGGTQHDRPS